MDKQQGPVLADRALLTSTVWSSAGGSLASVAQRLVPEPWLFRRGFTTCTLIAATSTLSALRRRP